MFYLLRAVYIICYKTESAASETPRREFPCPAKRVETSSVWKRRRTLLRKYSRANRQKPMPEDLIIWTRTVEVRPARGFTTGFISLCRAYSQWCRWAFSTLASEYSVNLLSRVKNNICYERVKSVNLTFSDCKPNESVSYVCSGTAGTTCAFRNSILREKSTCVVRVHYDNGLCATGAHCIIYSAGCGVHERFRFWSVSDAYLTGVNGICSRAHDLHFV